MNHLNGKRNLKELADGYANGFYTVREVVEETLQKIKQKDEIIKSILGLYSDELISQCVERAELMFDTANKTGDNSAITKLTGVPIIIKDNITVQGEKATAGSKVLANYIASYDATVINKLKEAGAILIARANMDEFAMGSSTENSAFGLTHNPLDISRVPGGSSGGSAAAVAAGYVTVALGSDTGGSVRQPAAFTGLVGLKPTYGAVSRYGLIAMGSSLDQVGPITKNVVDSETVFNIIKGKDEHDATSHDNISESNRDIKKRVAVPRSFVDVDGVDESIKNNFNQTLKYLESKGYEIVDIDIENIEKTLHAYYILCAAEVSSNMGRYDGVRYGMHIDGPTVNESITETRSAYLGKEVQRRILLGTYVLSSGYYDAYYNKALQLREKIRQEIRKVYESFDVVAMPISPVLPWRFGEKSDPLAAYLTDIFSVMANVIGVPAITVPTGHNDQGLPYSIQFLADWHREDILFAYGREVEQME